MPVPITWHISKNMICRSEMSYNQAISEFLLLTPKEYMSALLPYVLLSRTSGAM